MQVSKSLTAICAIAVCSSFISVHAQDNAAQAAARAALEQKMREIGGPGAPAAQDENPPMPPPKPKKAKAPPVAPPAEPMATPPPPMNVVAPGAASLDLIEQARQATRARLMELQNQKNAAQQTPAKQSAQQPVYQMQMETTPTETVATPSQPDNSMVKPEVKTTDMRAEKAREASEKKAAQARTEADAKAAKKTKADAKFEPVAPLMPLEGPASSLSATKEDRLQQLTDKYKADQISAEDYHDQRAKILAEP